MTYSRHARAALVLGLPLIGGHLAQVAIGVTDTAMLGWYSVDALAAVTLGSTYFFSLFVLGSGFAMAVMPLVAAYEAEGDDTSIRRATRVGLWLSLAFALLVLPLLLRAEPILLLLGQEPAVAADAARYLQWAGLGIIPAVIVMVLKSYLAALERTQVVFWITAASAVANGLANYALIFGNWGAPELGLVGAALASVITQIVSLIGVLAYILIFVPQHQLFVRFWRGDWPMLAKVFRLGIPIGLTMSSENGLFAASALMMGTLGAVPLAAHGIAVQLAAITFMWHLGLSNAATIRAGNAYGRRDLGHLARGATVAMALSLFFAAVTIAIFLAVPELLISLIIREDEPARDQIVRIGVVLVAMAALFQLVDGAQAIGLGVLRGVQDTQVPMVIAALSYWVLGIPVSYVLGLQLGWGGVGVWAGLVIGLGAAAVLLNWRFWKVILKRLEGAEAPATT
ncbi:MAG: MATE family efflux transporter [Pseudomonadota bacterium]